MGLFESILEPKREPEPRRKRVGATTESIALIVNRGGQGVVLEFDGAGIEADMDEVGTYALDDHGLDGAPDGISIWEGRLVVTCDYWTNDVECELVGKFRDLTEREWTLLRETGVSWEFEPVPT